MPPPAVGGSGLKDFLLICDMELFYSSEIAGGVVRLDAEESAHCVKVLRHRAGDTLQVIDGEGTMYECRLTEASPKEAVAEVLEAHPDWGAHPYELTVACCPTKNNDRYEWMVEKVTEIGVDTIVPVIGDRSERKVYKTDRARRIALSATKQSLKARIPVVEEPVSVKDFIKSCPADALRLIAYCFEDESAPRIGIGEALKGFDGSRIAVLIGPEGDFSPEEARLALSGGFVPVHLGPSRLRTETAAVTAATAVYLHSF